MGTGQYYVTVCIIQSFQKLFISSFVKFPSPYQDSHMQIIGGNPDHYQASPWHSPRHLQVFFSLSVQLPCGQARKM